MKKTIALFATITFATAVFAQEDDGTESAQETAVVEETPAVAEEPPVVEEPKKEKKSPIAVGSKEERPLGIRAGFNFSGVSYYGSTLGWHLGALYDVMRIFSMELGGDAFQFRMLLEPGAFVTSRKSAVDGGTQIWLEVPATAAFTLSLFGGMRIKYALGPYIAFGTIGTFSKNEDLGAPFFSIPFKREQSRLDFGQWHTFGFEQDNFKNWWVDFTFASGFIDAVSINGHGVSSPPWAMKFSFGYNF